MPKIHATCWPQEESKKGQSKEGKIPDNSASKQKGTNKFLGSNLFVILLFAWINIISDNTIYLPNIC